MPMTIDELIRDLEKHGPVKLSDKNRLPTEFESDPPPDPEDGDFGLYVKGGSLDTGATELLRVH